jgi:molybdenum cofactor guanylyltransferase
VRDGAARAKHRAAATRALMSPELPTPRASQQVAGVVLAGGRSVRFGGEKAAAMLAGKPLLMWAALRLQRSCVSVAINARPGTQAETLAGAAGLPVLHDAPGDAAGPLAGVKAGLIWASGIGARALAVSPCDVPLLPEELFTRLIAEAGQGAALVETAEGRQPLCAVWPVGALTAVSEALSGGAHPPTWRLLESLGARRVFFEDAGAFANVNSRADLEAITGRFERERAVETGAEPH